MRVTAFLVLAMGWGLVHAQTATFRSLESTSFPLLSNSSFVFDGTNSDIAQQLYIRHKAGDTDDKLSLNSVPTAVSERLDPLSIVFSDLPGLIQRAVLWDTGFAISPSNDPVQIWTMDDYTMADLAVPKADVSDEGCTFKNCSQPNDVTAYYTLICSGDQMLNVSRCVADTFEDSAASSYLGAMWAVGGDPDMTPQIRLRDHAWEDPVSKASYSVYAVHTVPSADDQAWNVCPAADGYASLTVPCHRRDEFTDAEMAKPNGTDWVTSWLEEEFAEFASEEAGLNNLLLIPIVLGVVVALSTIGSGLIWCRRKAASKLGFMQTEACDIEEGFSQLNCGTPPSPASRSIATTSHPTTPTSPVRNPPGAYEGAHSNKILKILLDSHHLQGKRIPYDNLVFEEAISKGGSGEVWVCQYNQQKVAAKRLLQTKAQNADKVHTFAEEIELSASLTHPHIVEFIGVAWNSLNNLVMVLELVPAGSLRSFLNSSTESLSWARCKIYIAVGIAQALEYLHDRTPPIIHRDLKSSNILLTSELEPKLIDFGVSRGLIDLTMTAGVGTPYWTAPEVLEGKRYTEQADIFSFGVVLSELDTGTVPYAADAREGGARLKHLQILKEVVAGTLRPGFSFECPQRIQRVGQACLAHNPASRPTARQLLRELEGDDQELIYTL